MHQHLQRNTTTAWYETRNDLTSTCDTNDQAKQCNTTRHVINKRTNQCRRMQPLATKPSQRAQYFWVFDVKTAIQSQSSNCWHSKNINCWHGKFDCRPEVSMDRIRIGYPAGYLQFFCIRIGFGYYFWKTLDQDICLICVTKSSWEWFKISQMMVLLFSLLWFLCSQKSKWFCQYVLHSSQSMIIRVTSS